MSVLFTNGLQANNYGGWSMGSVKSDCIYELSYQRTILDTYGNAGSDERKKRSSSLKQTFI
jgi:hypothetical protein